MHIYVYIYRQHVKKKKSEKKTLHTSASKQHKNQENAFTYKHTCGWEQTKIIVRPKLLLIHVHHPNEKKEEKHNIKQ